VHALSFDSAGVMTGVEECVMAIGRFGTLANGGFTIGGMRCCVAAGRQKEVDEQGPGSRIRDDTVTEVCRGHN
jgi:hypothetical protein